VRFVMSDKFFSVAGIVTDSKGRTKVRYCNDLVGRIKLFSKNPENKRVDFIELPNSMTKVDAIKFLMQHEKFSSSEDQMVLADALDTKSTEVKTTTKKVKASKADISLDTIRARKKNVSVEEVLAAVKEAE
jgi:hypothetical protein